MPATAPPRLNYDQSPRPPCPSPSPIPWSNNTLRLLSKPTWSRPPNRSSLTSLPTPPVAARKRPPLLRVRRSVSPVVPAPARLITHAQRSLESFLVFLGLPSLALVVLCTKQARQCLHPTDGPTSACLGPCHFCKGQICVHPVAKEETGVTGWGSRAPPGDRRYGSYRQLVTSCPMRAREAHSRHTAACGPQRSLLR